MADLFINKLDESITIKPNDFTAFDIADSATGGFYTKKISFSTLSNKISSDVISNIQLKLNTLQNNINIVASSVSNKLDKGGLSFDSKEKITGVLLLNSSLSTLGTADFGGEINVHHNKIIELADPIESYDAVHKKYVDEKVGSIPIIDTRNFLLKTGDSMTLGTLKLVNDPVDNMDSVPKKYVDEKVKGFSYYLPLTGGKMTGEININGNKLTNVPDITNFSSDGDAVNYKYVKFINPTTKYLPLSGGLMNTGFLNVNSNRIYGIPDVGSSTTDTDVVNKKYVDSRTASPSLYLPISGGTMTGIIDLGSKRLINVPDVGSSSQDSDAVNKKYVDSKTGGTPSGVLLLAGGTMTGDINLNSKKITNVADIAPSSALTDAVNKKYVDTRLALAGGTMTGLLTLAGISEKLGTFTKTTGVGGSVFTLDPSSGTTFNITLDTTIDRFLTINSPTDSYSITVVLTQNASAPYKVTNWTIDGTAIKWAGGGVPQITQIVSKIDIFAFTKIGSNWFGFIAGQNF